MTVGNDAVASDPELRIADLRRRLIAAYGVVPDSFEQRIKLFEGRQLDAMISLEEARICALVPENVEPKQVQLMQFAVYLALGSAPGAGHHGRAARSYGATTEELGTAAYVAFMAGGMGALHLAVDVLAADAS